jgi:tetratricopeptide (TPR) repeat protein
MLLLHLIERPGVLVTKEDLHAAVWGDAVVSDDTLTRTMAELRQALGDDARAPRIIETAHRRGFRFIARLHESRDQDSGTGFSSGVVPGPGTLVGRQPELDHLAELFKRACTGQRQIVFVEGEPGIGKSAVVDAFVHSLRGLDAHVQIGYGQCVEQTGEREAYMAVLEALERLGRSSSGPDVLQALRSVAPSWLAQLPSLHTAADVERLHLWHDLTTQQRMLREFAGLMEVISAQQPLVLVLEDLHWSDRGTPDLICMLAQRPEPARLMLIGTYRPAQAAALGLPIQHVRTTLRARRRCTEIVLEYLGRSHVAAYLADRLVGGRVTDDVVAVVHSRSDGNPLFMTVLVDELLARGWLALRDGEWALAASRETIEAAVPEDLRRLLEGLFLLGLPEEQEVLGVASVAGAVFEAPTVASALGLETAQVEAVCHGLCRAQRWIEDLGIREWPDGTLATRYRFRHALYPRVLYDRLSPSRRAALHDRIGGRLEAAFAGRTGEIASELATHFQAGRDARRAVLYLEQAAVRAYERLAYPDVMVSLDPALRVIEAQADSAERRRDELRLRRLHATVLSQTAGYTSDALLDDLARMQHLGRELDDLPAQFDALSELCLLHANIGDLDRAHEIAEELGELAARLDETAALQAYFLRGSVAVWRGQLRTAQSLLASALTLPTPVEAAERPYGVNPVVAARSFEGLRRWLVGDPAGARSVQEEAIAIAERHGRPFTLAQALTFRATVLSLEECWAEAGALATRTLEIADDYGFPLWQGAGLVIRGRALIEKQEAGRGLREMTEGLGMLRRSGLRLGLALRLGLLAGAYLRVNDPEQGLAAADAALTQSRETGARVFEAELWRLRGELLIQGASRQGSRRQASTREAEECFRKARTVARAQGALTLERRVAKKSAAAGSVRAGRRLA